jgi:hypothetical protein
MGYAMRFQFIFKLVILLSISALVLSACAGEPSNNVNGVEPTPVLDSPTTEVEVDPTDVDVPVEQDPTLTPQAGEDSTAEVPETGGVVNEEAQGVIDNPVLAFVSNIIGVRVVTQQGDEIGEIIDLAYDDHNGFVVYAIVSASGDTDAPLSRQIAFPWRLLAHPDSVTGDGVDETSTLRGSVPDPLVFGADAQLLRDAPALDTDELADEKFALWSQDLYYYWQEAYSEFHIVGVSDATVLAKISGLDRIQVIRGESGEFHPANDIVIDLGTGDMLYIVVEAGDLMPGDQGLVMVPYEYLNYGAREDGTIGYTFSLDEEQLENLPRLEQDAVPSEEQ